MAEVKRRRRKPKPLEEAIQFSLLKKDKEGLDGRFINDSKGRGVFSCTEFDKGDFLLEYRGDLISKEECERRQRVYHDALKVFLFEFRYDGKLLCVDAARDDASLGRLVNDDHINPNSKMKTIRVDGKPHLCLFAIRSICAGEEITYNYGDSEWPWRCTVCKPLQQELLFIGLFQRFKILSQIQLTVVSDQSGLMESRVCASTEGLEQVTPEKDRISLEGQDCVEKMPPVKELNEEQSFCGPTEGVKEICKHDVVTSAISSMDRCAECVGPVAALKWIGLRCKLCSSFWHKSCYSKFHEWTRKQSSLDVSSEEDEQSDEEYIPESESDSSVELTTRPARYDQAELLSDIQGAASSKFSEPRRSDETSLNLSEDKEKPILKARGAACVFEESGLFCHEEQLTDVEIDSESDRSGECHLPRKQDSEVRRSTDEDSTEKLLNAKRAATLREEGRESSMAEADQCEQSANISCSANSKNYCYICGKPQSKLARHLKTHMSDVEVLAKISKLLLAMEKGCLPNIQGKSLDDIEIEDEISMTDSDASDLNESESEDDAPAGAAGVSSDVDVHKMPIEETTEVLRENESEAEIENPRRGQKVCWSDAEVSAVMKHFKAHIMKGKLATLTECQQCKTAEDPVLARRSAQNIRDFVRNRGITLKRKAQSK
ncbi:hypothetical protein PO909_029528 [Leuciscus waleckii]